eukprot:g25115.t1
MSQLDLLRLDAPWLSQARYLARRAGPLVAGAKPAAKGLTSWTAEPSLSRGRTQGYQRGSPDTELLHAVLAEHDRSTHAERQALVKVLQQLFFTVPTSVWFDSCLWERFRWCRSVPKMAHRLDTKGSSLEEAKARAAQRATHRAAAEVEGQRAAGQLAARAKGPLPQSSSDLQTETTGHLLATLQMKLKELDEEVKADERELKKDRDRAAALVEGYEAGSVTFDKERHDLTKENEPPHQPLTTQLSKQPLTTH